MFGSVLLALTVTRQWVATREVKEITERQRDAVLASVSHGLRTPLTAVQGYAQLLNLDWARFAEIERRQMVRDIEEQALHLGRVVTDIIDLTRGQTSSVRLEPEPAARRSDSCRWRSIPSPPPSRSRSSSRPTRTSLVDADQDRLQQILVNLLTNAVRYGKQAHPGQGGTAGARHPLPGARRRARRPQAVRGGHLAAVRAGRPPRRLRRRRAGDRPSHHPRPGRSSRRDHPASIDRTATAGLVSSSPSLSPEPAEPGAHPGAGAGFGRGLKAARPPAAPRPGPDS